MSGSSVPTVNEGDGGDGFRVSFRNSSGVLEAPTTLAYSIYCLTNAQAVRAEESITPTATSVTIALEQADTVILDDTNDLEIREVTLISDKGLETQKTAVARYQVRNLHTAT